MRSRALSIAVVASLVGVLLPAALGARAEDGGTLPRADGGYPCPGAEVTVYARLPRVAELVCGTVEDAAPALTACGLPPHDPLSLYVVDRIEGPALHCLGVYLCETNEIAVLSPRALAEERDASGQTFTAVNSETLFPSLVVHELTHARLSGSRMERSLGIASQEYIAYAMQLAALPRSERDAFLAGVDASRRAEDALNEVMLLMAPDVFIASAWRHFDQPGRGCAFVRSLIDGTAALGLEAAE